VSKSSPSSQPALQQSIPGDTACPAHRILVDHATDLGFPELKLRAFFLCIRRSSNSAGAPSPNLHFARVRTIAEDPTLFSCWVSALHLGLLCFTEAIEALAQGRSVPKSVSGTLPGVTADQSCPFQAGELERVFPAASLLATGLAIGDRSDRLTWKSSCFFSSSLRATGQTWI
jgi:hypothetical protein